MGGHPDELVLEILGLLEGADVLVDDEGYRLAVATTPIPYEALVGTPDFDHRTTGTLMDSLTVDAAEAAAITLYRSVEGEAA